jgi:4-amino-4-deoxy-L-arabinose transferase-like glycosyltransferase
VIGESTAAAPPAGLRLGRAYWPLVVAVLALLSLPLWLNLDHFQQWDNDEGMYALTARALLAGRQPYTEVWLDQPPGAAYWLVAVFGWLGTSVAAARGAALLLALAGALGVASIARRLGGDLAGLASLPILVLAPQFWWLSRSINPHLPSMAPAVVGLAVAWRYRDTGQRWLLPLAGLLLGLGLWIKLSPAYLLAPMALLVVQRHRPTMAAERRRVVRRLAVDLALLALPVILISATWFLVAPPGAVWYGVFTSYLSARDVYPDRRWEYVDWLVRENLLGENVGAFALTVLGLGWLARRGRPGGSALLLWLVLSCLAVVLQRPMFPKQHWSILLWPLAVGAGLGVAALVALARAWRQRPAGEVLPRRWRVAGALAAVVFAVSSLSHLPSLVDDLAPRPFSAAIAGVQWLHEHTRPEDVVISDNGLVLFRAGRPTPPGLANFSTKRIRTGNLTDAQLIDAAASSRAVAILLWNDQITDFKGFLAWMRGHYDLVKRVGDDREIWQRRDLATPLLP